MKYLVFGLIAAAVALSASAASADETVRAPGSVTLKPTIVQGQRQVPIVIEIARQKPNVALHPLVDTRPRVLPTQP